ncbi:unnamed protein product [Peronospora destructor]|uniref:Uncharacterized protein n=1 Tax=Peronospora destructor TaxID=86335 RepID=A0AAV0VFM5_9STRA|nr:unnamed protein product [Peronospora destructor]
MKCTSVTFYRDGDGFVISGGNFHGEYMAKLSICFVRCAPRMHLRLFTHLRTYAPKFYKDRVMKSDIDALLDLVRSGAICEVAAPFLTELHVLEL